MSALCATTAGVLLPGFAWGIGEASQINLAQIVYSGGNWQPRPTALRRLAWEIHKRTSLDISLEPGHVKPFAGALAASPLIYLSGDRPFTPWQETSIDGLRRFLHLGGTLIIDPAYTIDGDDKGFSASVDELMSTVLPEQQLEKILTDHVIFRSFYSISRPVGRRLGSPYLTGYSIGDRLAVIRDDHDLAGAWARDNLGNWEHDVTPGGSRQRERAFRLGVNMVMYALCLDYKNEQPHRRFGASRRK